MTRRIPPPTRGLIQRLRRVAVTLDRASAAIDRTRDPVRYARARDHFHAVWSAIGRLEELAAAVEELAPIAELAAATREADKQHPKE